MRLVELRGYVYPLVLTFQLIFGFLQLLDYFGVRYHPMIQRNTAASYFELGFSLVVPMVALMVAWAAVNLLAGRWSLLLASAPLFYSLYSLELGVSMASLFMCLVGVYFMEDRGRFTGVLLWVLSFFLGLGVVHWGIIKPLGVASPLTSITDIMYSVHHVLRRLFPFLVLPFLFFWLTKPLLGFKLKLLELNVIELRPDRFSWLLLGFSLFLSVYAAFYPYFPAVNPGGVDFGVDFPDYQVWLYYVEHGEQGGLTGGVGAQRLFFFLVFYGVSWVTGLDNTAALRILPVLLNPLFVSASGFFSWELFRNSRLAAWCAFLSATGMVLTVGLYAYFLSNLLALSIVLFSFGLLFRAVREGNPRLLVLASVVGCLLVFTHPWTMDQYLACLVPVIGFLVYRRGARYMSQASFLGIYLVVIGLAEAAKILILRSGGGVAGISTAASGFVALNDIWSSLFFCFPFVYGGFISNLVLLGLATAGIYVFGSEGVSGRYLATLVLLSSLVYFVSFETNKSRLLYNLPFGFFGSLALYILYERGGFSSTVFVVVYSLFYFFVSVGSLVW